MNKAFFDLVQKAQAEGNPIATYKKAIRGRIGVSVIDVFSGNPSDMVLSGDTSDPSVDQEDYTLTMWTEFENEYFRRANKVLLRLGYIVPAEILEVEEVSVNEVSDEELHEILSQPFFTLKAYLNKVTSDIPVMRLLHIAEDMNKSIGTMKVIKEKLSELQRHDEV